MSQTSAITPDQFTHFGELLKFLRHRSGLTQREFSVAVNYSEGQISHLEHNQRAPNAAVLQARFVPALELEREPEWTARLLELAARSRGDVVPQTTATTAKSSRNNLPTQLTSFVGRAKEMALVAELLHSTRLLTLTGVGGVGKTRLAVQVARHVDDRFDDGVWMVELAPLADTRLIPLSVVRALRVPEGQGSPLSALVEYLHPRRLLLIVDNCEHLIQGCAELADALLRECPKLSLLAISREPLAIGGETSWIVPPLQLSGARDKLNQEHASPPEAVELFVERARAVMPTFRLTRRNESAIARICRRVDGVPLAIELAAARLKGMELEEIAERLDTCFQLLTNGNRTAVPRQRTLQATIDWSYALLTESERVLLRRLPVFAGGWTIDAAEKVCGVRGLSQEHVLDLLFHLLDKSLVVAESARQEKRYRLLETIRQYAANKLLESGEIECTRDSHLEYMLGLAEQAEPHLKRPEQNLWLERLEEERDNLRAAWEWAIDRDPERALRLSRALLEYWMRRGYTNEARNKMDRLVTQTQEWGTSIRRAEVLFIAGRVALRDSDYSTARTWMEEGLTIARAVGSKREIAIGLRGVGIAARGQGDNRTARQFLEQAVELLRELGEDWYAANALHAMTFLAGEEGDLNLAKKFGEEAIALFRNVGDLPSIAYVLNALGMAAALQGDHERAAAFYNESLEIAAEYPNIYQQGLATWCLGHVYRHLGDISRARCFMEESINYAQMQGSKGPIYARLISMAGVIRAEGEPERAARLLGAGEAGLESADLQLELATRIEHEHIRSAIRAQLGDASFIKSVAEGRALELDQALALALEKVN